MHKSKPEHFWTAHTAHLEAVSNLWHQLQMNPFVEDCIDEWVQPMHILLIHQWLSACESEKNLLNTHGIPEKTIWELCKTIAHKIAHQKRSRQAHCHS